MEKGWPKFEIPPKQIVFCFDPDRPSQCDLIPPYPHFRYHKKTATVEG